MKIYTELTRFGAAATADELRDQARRLEDAGSSGISPEQSLADNPYTLRGEPQQIADAIEERRERLDLYQITIQENQDSVEFCQAVVPLLSK